MLSRRRCMKVDIISVLITPLAIVLLFICTILYGTRTESPEIPSLVKQFLPAGRCLCQSSTTFMCDTCIDLSNNFSSISVSTKNNQQEWQFTYGRDDKNWGLNQDMCHTSFPGLFEDIERAVKSRHSHHINEIELSSFELSKGMVHAMIFDGQLYILQTHLVDQNNRKKAVATLYSIHRAVTAVSNRSSIPNIEFVFSVEDLPRYVGKPLWVLARRAQDQNLWLIPDFGFWSWDVRDIGPISEVTGEIVAREAIQPWESKEKQLVWRGKISFAPKLRRALIDAAKGKSWSAVRSFQWGDRQEFDEQFLGPVDQCRYMFIAHAEGRSYSGALKYRQLCRSVVVSHKLQWIQHHHYLLRSSGPNQNYVEVERDFSDLEKNMDYLLAHPEEARRIADNSVRTFRERYLTPTAEACYWRALFDGWKKVSFEPKLYEDKEGGAGRERKRGVRFETFALLEPEYQMSYLHNK